VAGKSSAGDVQREAGSVGTRDTVPRGIALAKGMSKSRLESKKKQRGWAMPDQNKVVKELKEKKKREGGRSN
jgi:hypothetical protein